MWKAVPKGESWALAVGTGSPTCSLDAPQLIADGIARESDPAMLPAVRPEDRADAVTGCGEDMTVGRGVPRYRPTAGGW